MTNLIKFSDIDVKNVLKELNFSVETITDFLTDRNGVQAIFEFLGVHNYFGLEDGAQKAECQRLLDVLNTTVYQWTILRYNKFIPKEYCKNVINYFVGYLDAQGCNLDDAQVEIICKTFEENGLNVYDPFEGCSEEQYNRIVDEIADKICCHA